MIARISISLESESFRESTLRETARILRLLAQKLEKKEHRCPIALTDREGNVVGFFDFFPD